MACTTHALHIAVLTDEDLVHAVLLQLAHLHRGVRPFINAGAVSSLWRRAARLADEHIARWFQHRWHADLSHAHLDDGYGYKVMDLQFRAGAYDWTVRVWPALEVVQPHPIVPNQAWFAPVQVVAAQLRVPSLETLPESWSRRAEWSLTIHHPSDSSLDFIKYYRIHFASGRISAFPKVEPSVQTPSWEGKVRPEGRLCQSCDNVNGARFSLGATQKLMRDGFIVGRQLRLSLQIRVNPGSSLIIQILCSSLIIRSQNVSILALSAAEPCCTPMSKPRVAAVQQQQHSWSPVARLVAARFTRCCLPAL